MRRVLTIALCLLAWAAAWSQNTTLFKEMQKLQEQYGVHFVYDANLDVNIEFKCVKRKKEELAKHLHKLLDGTDIEFKMRGKNITLCEKTKEDAAKKYKSVQLKGVTVNGCTDKAALLKYMMTAMSFNKSYPQEKVYLHFDNTGYFENETIWFKAYVTRTDDGNFSDLSKVLYVELLNPSGDVINTKKLYIDDKGQANGEFPLDSLYGSGYYEVRAYTRYMTNWGTNACFSRVFPVFKAPAEEGNYKNPTIRTINYKARDPNNREDDDSLFTAAINEGLYTSNLAMNVTVKFYPEGGDIIAGKKNRIAMWAVDDNGYPYEMMGQILDENDSALAIVQTDSTGRGLFEIIPGEGKLTLVTTNLKNKVRQFDLPLPKAEGCQLFVDAVSDEISATMQFTDSLCQHTIGYVLMHSGNVINCDTLTAEPVVCLNFHRNMLKEGVNQLTVIGTDGRILAERQIFICPEAEEEGDMAVSSPTDRLRPCGKVELEISTLPNSSFSFSAMDAATLNNGVHGNMKTWMLLSSEVRGYIHNVDYYFEADDEEHRKAADMLMLTQGWRRYDWNLMSGQEKLKNGQMIEDKFYVYGKLREFRKRNTIDDVSLSATLYNRDGQVLKGKTITDADGNYAFELPFVNGEWELQIYTTKRNAKGRDKRKTFYVGIDRRFSPVPRYITHEEASIAAPNASNVEFSTQYEDDDEFKHIAKRNHLLENVTVKAKKRYFTNDDFLYKNESWAKKAATIYYDLDKERDAIRDRGEEEPSLAEFLVKKNRAIKPWNEADITEGLTYNGLPMKCIIDNNLRHSGFSMFSSSLDEVRCIYIAPYTTCQEADMSISSVPVTKVFIFLHHIFTTASQKGLRRTYFQGFNTPETFKQADYTNLPPVEDFRRTLYWNPNVRTDKDGKAKVSFFNNSSCRHLFISAEGMSQEGKMIVY